MIRLVIIAVILFFSSLAFADAPKCHTHPGGNYCSYSGLVENLYINSSNTILLYFDTSISPEEAAAVGFTITNGGAAAFNITDNPAFANLFYSTALSAQATGRRVTIQMRGTVNNGYLKFDRIWLEKP